LDCNDDLFIIGSVDKTLKTWNRAGQVLQTFLGHLRWVKRVMNWRSDVVVSASGDAMLKVWRVSTGECLQTLPMPILNECDSEASGLGKLSADRFISASCDGGVRVWGRKGECLEIIEAEYGITAIARLGNHSLFL